MKKSCISSISTRLKMMSAAEQRVADYILNKGEEVLQLTVTELAEKVGVCDATVIRFCRSAGYKGYQDFKINLAGEITRPVAKTVLDTLSREDSVEDIVQKVINSEMSALSETIKILDMELMKTVSETILHAHRVVFFGTGGSLIVTMDAMHKFLKIGLNSVLQLDSDMQKMESSLLTKGDVAIAVSHSGSNRHVIECIKNAKSNGATVVGIMTIGKSPMQKLCDYIIMVPTKELVFRSESVTARIAQLAVFDCLVSIMSYMEYEKAQNSILKTRNATSGNKS